MTIPPGNDPSFELKHGGPGNPGGLKITKVKVNGTDVTANVTINNNSGTGTPEVVFPVESVPGEDDVITVDGVTEQGDKVWPAKDFQFDW